MEKKTYILEKIIKCETAQKKIEIDDLLCYEKCC